ncbi:alkaline phosphatase family protein [Candidatus Omnitrophota bacterium]
MRLKSKVLLIGLDGLTWDVLDPLLREGILPNIKKIIAEGVSGELESIIPPVTGPSWLAMATGLNPGKTGVFDFIKLDRKTFTLSPITSDDYRGKAFWDIANKQNRSAFILNFPMLYPPYEIDGVMVGGLGSSDVSTISYPQDYLKGIVPKLEDYQIKVPYNLSRYTNNQELFFQDIEKLLMQYKNILSKAFSDGRFDLLTFIFSATDFVLHYTWRYWDKTYFAYKQDHRIENMIKRFWRQIDGLIGWIYDYASSNSSDLLLVSDHGFGKQDEIFRINSWLVERGFLRVKTEKVVREKVERKIGTILKKIDMILGGDFYTKAKNKTGRKKSDLFKQFDLEKSRAIAAMFSDLVAGIYIIDESQKEAVRDEIVREIEEEGTRSKIKIKAFSPDEVYSGQYLEAAPDILLYIDDFRCSMDSISLSKRYFEAQKRSHLNKSGTHRLNGLFIASGPKIRKNSAIDNAKILDICPTVLYLMGLEIPDNVDGRVLKGIFRGEFLDKNDVRYLKVEAVEKQVIPETDVEQMIDTLESLGYM